MEVLALIPARGGSKSVPKKNLQVLNGVPLVVHSIRHARESSRIDRVVVSTDDPAIAAVAVDAGAEVPFMRPAQLAEDATPDLPVFKHALHWLAENEGYRPDLVVHLRPTFPIRQSRTIDEAIQLLADRPDADSLRSVAIAHQSPYKMWRVDEAGCLQPVVYLDDGQAGHNLPRQSLPRVYWQNGYVDVIRSEVIETSDRMGGDRILSFATSEDGVEIDYPEDLVAAERLIRGETGPQSTSDRFPS